MTKLNFILLMLSFFMLDISAQKLSIKGKLIDAQSKEAVIYAAICIQNSTKGVSSNEDGSFELLLKKTNANQKIAISAIGYQDTIISISELKTNFNTIYLKEKAYQIQETVVIGKRKKEFYVDKIRRSILNQLSISGPSDPRILAKYFEYKPQYEEAQIKEISLVLNRENDSHIEPTFILRVFARDSLSGKPSKDLLAKCVVKLPKCKPQMHFKYTHKLKEYIPFPENGVYVGVEWIAIESNRFSKKSESFSPWLHGKMRKKIKHNLWKFSGGKWNIYPQKIPSEPYIELKLIN